MRNYLIPTLITALLAEVITSWWVWTSWPFDTLDLLYRGSFWVYEAERLVPWLISVGSITLIRLLVGQHRGRKLWSNSDS
jgi:hypothetical protein